MSPSLPVWFMADWTLCLPVAFFWGAVMTSRAGCRSLLAVTRTRQWAEVHLSWYHLDFPPRARTSSLSPAAYLGLEDGAGAGQTDWKVGGGLGGITAQTPVLSAHAHRALTLGEASRTRASVAGSCFSLCRLSSSFQAGTRSGLFRRSLIAIVFLFQRLPGAAFPTFPVSFFEKVELGGQRTSAWDPRVSVAGTRGTTQDPLGARTETVAPSRGTGFCRGEGRKECCDFRSQLCWRRKRSGCRPWG